jgi:uncharacterized protein (TIGR02145 family)
MKKSIMFTLGLAALFCAACVDNSTNGSGGGEVDALLEKYNNPNGGSGGGGGGGGGGDDGDGNSLVLGNGQAWTSGNFGYIFTSNNRVFEIYKVGGSWWYADSGNYETNGNIITINSVSGTYSISGSTLLLSKYTYTFAKTSGISPKAGVAYFVDSRDNQSYNAKKIGTQIWMTKNMNYDVPSVMSDVCYDNNPSYCVSYGRLYDWNTAKNAACPAGFHLPSDSEWSILVNFAGGESTAGSKGESTAGSKLKSKIGWSDNGNGTDEYGFAALPGGYCSSDGNFNYYFDLAGSEGYWWSATKGDAVDAWVRYVYNGNGVGVYGDNDSGGTLFSVRCVLD